MNETKTITIPANGVYTENFGAASCFYCVDATTVFRFRAGNGKAVELGREKKHGGKGGKAFGACTFYNDSAAANIVTFFVGTQEFTGSATRIYTQDAPTQMVGGYVLLSSGVASGVLTNVPVGKTRRQFVVSNQSSNAGDVQIYDVNGAVAGRCPPGHSFTIFTSGDIQLYQDFDAGDIGINFLEVYYT